MLSAIFEHCRLIYLDEFLLFFLLNFFLFFGFCYSLVALGAANRSRVNTPFAILLYVGAVGLSFAAVWLVDERILLAGECAAATTSFASFIIWLVAFLASWAFNWKIFGRRLKKLGYYS